MQKHIFFLALLFCANTFSLHSYEKWIVVTTIQYPTTQLKNLATIPGWRLVVVGDKKTPPDWHLDNCDYLSPSRQLSLGYQLTSLLPWNHYSRKNIGYLFAIEHGAKIIYETDDDNETLDGLNPSDPISNLPQIITKDRCFNIYTYFGHPEIWPRGYPLDQILHPQPFQLSSPTTCVVGAEQGVVNESPDVDALFRLTQDKVVAFDAKETCFLPKNTFCPFNSQNTFFHPIAFFSLYIPSSVTMRVSDIWRGYIAQRLMWHFGAYLAFSGPNAIQKRNVHCLLNDFSQEQALYLQSTPLVDFLHKWNGANSQNPIEAITCLYNDLAQKGFVKEQELTLLKAWNHDLKQIGYPQIFQGALFKNTSEPRSK